jgi:hypothetical protein
MIIKSPNVAENIILRPFTCDDQKNLSNYSIDDENFLYTINNILQKHTTFSDFDHLTIVDWFFILIQYRCFYVGSTCDIRVTCDCGNDITHTLDLYDVAVKADTVLNITHTRHFEYNVGEIILDFPHIWRIDEVLKGDALLPALFIKSIKGNNLCQFSLKDVEKIYNSLSFEYLEDIHRYFREMMNIRVENTIVCRCSSCKERVIKHMTLFELLRFTIDVIYRFNYKQCLIDYYDISKNMNISVDYISGISPIEKNAFIEILREQQRMEKDAKD